MVETIYMVAGWLMLVGGMLGACWLGWRDAGKGHRRCPKCWYDMGATAGMKCPECGSETKNEKQLHRSNRRWRYVLVGLACVLAAYPIMRVPRVQKDGIVGLLPHIAILAAWPELLNPAALKAKDVHWWQISSSAVSRILEESAGHELSALETRLLILSSLRAIESNGPNAGAGREILLALGPDMGPVAARKIVDLWFAGKLRLRGQGYGRSFFTELPDSGRGFLDEVIEKVRANPSLLFSDPTMVEWVLVQRGSIAELIPALDAVLASADWNVVGNFYQQFGTLPLPGEDAVRTARMIRIQPQMGEMQLSYVLPQAGVADRFVADYREALTEGGNRVSSALVGAARAGRALKELQPEVELHLQNPDEGIRFQAEVVLAMMQSRPGDVEDRVFDSVRGRSPKVVVGGRITPEEKLAWAKETVAVAALCSGAWHDDVACEVLTKAIRNIEPKGLPFTTQQAIEFILMHPDQVRKHADVLNLALRSNAMCPLVFGKRVRMYAAADAIAPGLEQAADVATSPFLKRVFRAQAAEAREMKEQRTKEAGSP